MIKTIFFDVGGTLLHPDLERLLAPLLLRVRPTEEHFAVAERASKHGASVRANAPAYAGVAAHSSLSALSAPDPGPSINKGHWQVYFEALLDSLGCCQELLPELVARASDSSFWTMLDPDAIDTLERLRHNYRLAIISNADGRIGQLLTRAGIAGFFEQIIDSGLVGCEKPDPRIFHAGLAAMEAEAAASLYIGDIYRIDYCGATGVGMLAVLLDPAGVYRGWPAPCLKGLAELPAWLQASNGA